jgi:hypothetical protein
VDLSQNKKAPVRRLFEPEAFHTGNYTEILIADM